MLTDLCSMSRLLHPGAKIGYLTEIQCRTYHLFCCTQGQENAISYLRPARSHTNPLSYQVHSTTMKRKSSPPATNSRKQRRTNRNISERTEIPSGSASNFKDVEST